MTRDDIIRMAREAGAPFSAPWWLSEDALERFARLAYEAGAECNKVAQWMMSKGYATGHGDSAEDLLKELEWQIAEREREACAQIARKASDNYEGAWIANAIRKRGKQ